MKKLLPGPSAVAGWSLWGFVVAISNSGRAVNQAGLLRLCCLLCLCFPHLCQRPDVPQEMVCWPQELAADPTLQ